MGKRTTHCPQGHEYTEENTRWRTVNRKYKDGTSYTQQSKSCRECEKNYRETNKDRILARNNEWNRNNPEKRKEIVSKSGKKEMKLLRKEANEAYGGKCACCGESTPDFLHLDHINSDGAEHRRSLSPNSSVRSSGGSKRMIRWAKKNNWPDTLQLLCHNCGMAEAWYGECPHQRDKK